MISTRQFRKKYGQCQSKLNLSKIKSEIIYAQGIATFINLLESIRVDGFDRQQKIGLYKACFLRKPDYGEKIARKVYMGDGCHRLACLIWLEKKILLPKEFFKKTVIIGFTTPTMIAGAFMGTFLSVIFWLAGFKHTRFY